MSKIVTGIATFLLVLAVLSTMVITTATTNVPKANNDTFNFNIWNNAGCVLDNDRGQGITVCTVSPSANGATILMQCDGTFAYLPSAYSAGKTVQDTFTYTITDKTGKKSTARVTINFKFSKLTGLVQVGTHPLAGTPDLPQ